MNNQRKKSQYISTRDFLLVVFLIITIFCMILYIYPLFPEIFAQILLDKESRDRSEGTQMFLTNTRIAMLGYDLREYYGKHNTLPDHLHAWLKKYYYKPSSLKDAWGKPFLIRSKNVDDGNLVSIHSAGRDGLFGTDDDRIEVIPVNRNTVPSIMRQRTREVEQNQEDLSGLLQLKESE